MTRYKIVEKRNHLAVHQLHDSLETAEKSLREVIPEYVKRGYYTDKTLKAEDFEIISYQTPKTSSSVANTGL